MLCSFTLRLDNRIPLSQTPLNLPMFRRPARGAQMEMYCPQCKKGPFYEQSRLLKHLNNPASPCLPWIEQLEHLRSAQEQAADHDSAMDPRQSSPSPGMNTSEEASATPPASDYVPDFDTRATPEMPHTGYVYDFFPGASQVYGKGQTFLDIFNGKGQTFLDIFNDDPFAYLRRDNLYYPFADRDEYEFASMLSR
jgi:hypothetical protein